MATTQKMQARLLFPQHPCYGNLLWDPAQFRTRTHLLKASLEMISQMGYWASPFPEGDGVAFSYSDGERCHEKMHSDFKVAFAWLDLSSEASGSVGEVFEFDEEKEVVCTVMVPLAKVKIEDSFELGKFRFVCARFFDPQPELRLANYEGEYLQFKMIVKYGSLIRAARTIESSDALVKQCLSHAEHAMDVMRYQFSSFVRPEFTPNPAGQMSDGFYSVTLLPCDVGLRQIDLGGIALPMASSNNWLGPQLEDAFFRGKFLLTDIVDGKNDQVSLRIKAALRSCRQSFYALGDESRFLNLIFTLDGLLDPKEFKGWKHRTYIAAVISAGSIDRFPIVLERYDFLYTDVRNRLVHGGKDFYELNTEAALACQDLYQYIRDVIALVEENGIESGSELHDMARNWLLTAPYVAEYSKIISKVDAVRGKTSKPFSWA